MARKGKTDQTHAGKRKPWQFMTKFVISDDKGSPYLIRWRVIQTPYAALYLHKFLRGDSDPFVHDHPWNFISIVLRGGYVEMRRNNMTHKVYPRHVKHINVMHTHDAHYISTLDRVPTWSLLLVGRRVRTWGFWQSRNDMEPGKVQNQTWTEFDNWEGR